MSEQNTNAWFAPEPSETTPTPEVTPTSTAPQITTTAIVGEAPESQQTTVETTDPENNDLAKKEIETKEIETKDPLLVAQKKLEELERRIEEKDRLVADLARQSKAPEPQAPPTPKITELPEPTLAMFRGDVEKFTKAQVAWVSAKNLDALSQQQKQEAYLADFNRRVNEFKAKAPDYESKVGELYKQYPNVPADINEFLSQSEKAPAILHHLATNPDVMKNLVSTQSPIRRAAELGRIEDKVSAPKAPPVKTVSSAPKPPSSTHGSSPVTRNLNDPNLSQSEYRELRTQQLRSMGRG